MKQKIKTLVALVAILGSFLLPATPALAASLSPCPTGYDHPKVLDKNGNPTSDSEDACSTIKKASDCNGTGVNPNDHTRCIVFGNECNGNSQSTCLANNPIIKDLNTFVQVLSYGVGVIVGAVIIIGGIQYSMAGNNPQAVAAAKKRIMNGIIAMVAFIFTFAFLNWLIPGGVFK